MDQNYQIGSFPFRILCPDQIQPPANLELFRASINKVDYTYEICLSAQFPALEGTIIAQRPDLTVLQTQYGESRLLGIAGIPGFYACYQETEPDRAVVTVTPACMELLHSDTVFNSLLALERRMIGLDSLILHCSYTRYRGKAILFSAPSETGKSTQSDLWTKYRGAETINGDRALLRQVNGQWAAEGWPVCGSSELCHNSAAPIRAIVMLSQAKENRAEQLTGMSAFRKLFSQVTVNRWNIKYTQRVMDLLDALCGAVPVYHLGCTISEEAVSCLEQVLD